MTNREQFRKYTDDATFARITDDGTVAAMWQRCAAEYADQPAIVFDGETRTFAQLDQDAAHFRAVLADAGVTPGMRVAIYAANSYAMAAALVAVITSGCTAAMLPPHLPAPAVMGCCAKFGAKALVWQESLPNGPAAAEAAARVAVTIPLSAASEKTAPAAVCQPADGCLIMFTGGTSGKSKGVLLSHKAVMQGIMNGCYGYQDVFGQRYMLILPLTHVFGMIRNLLTSLYTGSALFICKDNKDMFRDIAMFRPTVLVAVPALAEMALSLCRRFKRNMLGEDLKYIICGAAAVPGYLVRAYHEMGIALFPGYGLTESANLVSGNPESLAKPESVGLPYPNMELKIVDGELWLRGDNMLDAYLGEEQPAWQDGWFRTGDLARFDEDGFLYITGRCKEVIVLPNGENISPAEVEQAFDRCVLVAASQVFEDVDENGRHFLALEVVPRATEMALVEGDAAAKLNDELWQINATLPAFARVSRITVRETDFDRTPSMKIVRYKKC